MITFTPFFETLKKRGISQYRLVNDYNFSHGTLDAMKHDRSMTLATLNSIMELLDIKDINEVIAYVPSGDVEKE